jgi:hypothetical protein
MCEKPGTLIGKGPEPVENGVAEILVLLSLQLARAKENNHVLFTSPPT